MLAALHAPLAELETDDALVRLTAVLAAAELTPERRPGDDALVVRLPGGPAYAIVPVPEEWAGPPTGVPPAPLGRLG